MTTTERPAIGVSPGDVLAGKYRVERVLGAGGMGVVVAAHHIQLDEKVALKFLLPEALGSPEALMRFEREARAAVKIKSEHVARVSDVGRLESGAPYMVMEYLDGGDLHAWLHERGPMPVEQAVEFVLQACEAIAEAHVLGIVHRDLKPANLFVVRRADGLLSVKVLDFGISKVMATNARGVPASSSLDAGVTKTTAVMGSPLYMSPEQIQSSKGVDWRTDIWSLGVILYELVSGRQPFEAEQMMELVVKIATGQPTPLLTVRPDVGASFQRVVMQCLEKEPARRFQNVGELARSLKDFAPKRSKASIERIMRTLEASGVPQAPLPGSGTAHMSAQAILAATPRPAAGTQASWGQTGAGAHRSTNGLKVTAAIGAAVVMVAVAVGAMMVRSNSRDAAAASGSAASVSPIETAPPASMTPVAAPLVAELPSLTPAEDLASASATPSIGRAPIAPARARTTTTTTPTVAPAPKPNCDPPYYYDQRGRRVFKQECL